VRIGTHIAFLSLFLALTIGAAEADILHLAGGGTVETDSWWEENGSIFYRSPAGTVGLPREEVLRIQPTSEESPTQPVAEAESTPPPPVTTRRVPRELAVRILAAREALEAREFEKAAAAYHKLIHDVADDDQEPRVGYALAQMALGEDRLAQAVVLDGLARDPRQAQLLELRGDLYNREERVPDALRSWLAARDRAPAERLNTKIEKAQRELAAGRDYELSLSRHFNLRYDGEVDMGLADAVTEFLEQQYWEMARELDATPRQPITVILYPERAFRDVTQSAEWVGGLYDGKIRIPIAGLTRLNPQAKNLLKHELTHAFVHSKSRGQTPRWLQEGLAQHFEGRTLSRADRHKILERLREGDAAEWTDRGFSYPLAMSLTQFLIERRGFGSLVDLVEQLGEGQPLDTAMDDIYGMDYSESCRRWASETMDAGTR